MKRMVNSLVRFLDALRSQGVGQHLERGKRQLGVWVNQRCSGCERGRLKIGLVAVSILVSAYLLWVIMTAFD